MPQVSRIGNGDSTLSTCQQSVAKAEAADTSAKRLEDVEKIVRQHDREIDALVDAVCELIHDLNAKGVNWFGPGLD